MILDEPTANLDNKAKSKLLQYLIEETMTKIIITHDKDVLNLADKVYSLFSSS